MIEVTLSETLPIQITVQSVTGELIADLSKPSTIDAQIISIARGEKGDQAPNQIFVQPTEPNFSPDTVGLWVQTVLGANGDGLTIWIEDGLDA